MNILSPNPALRVRAVLQTRRVIATALLFVALSCHLYVFAQSTAFTYQGVLKDGSAPANGKYDLQFSLFDAATAGTLVGGPVTNAPVAVSNGVFTVALDFGANSFPGADRWLEIGVRTNGSLGAYAVLAPRQPLSTAPYALSAARLGGFSAAAFAPTAHIHDDRYYTKAQIDAMLAQLGGRVSSLEGTTYNALPPTPPSLSATVSGVGVAVQWQYYPGSFATGFYLQRSLDGTNFSQLAVLSANSTSYLDQVVVASTTYYYRLVAYNNNGSSAASAVASVTIPAVNAGSCSGGLAVLVLDPPIVTAGEPLQIHLFTSGLAATNPAAQIQLIGPIGQTNLSFSIGSSPNELFATSPKGWLPGALTLRVVAANSNCATAPLQVTGSTALNPLSVSPSQVSPTQPTPLSITGQGFAAGARAYIVPAGGGGLPLQSVLYNSSSSLTALAPGGLTAGAYDLVVINPDASAGSAPGAFVVLSSQPPIVTDVSPQYIANLSGQTVVLTGQGFVSGAQVTLDCLNSGNTRQQLSGTVGTLTSTSIQVTFDASALPSGCVGIVRVTNPDGGPGAYYTISVTSAGSENSWTTMANLNTARRALSLVAARAPTGNGWLYALGGDAGSSTSPYNTVESAPFDPFGITGSWTGGANNLPIANHFAGAARVGSFVYLVGGNNGVSTLSSVSRAQILDLAPTPAAPTFSAVLDGTLNGGGIGAGYVQYRVSALLPPSDPKNPNGESMAGPAIGVQVSSTPNLELVLSWPAFSGASGYRVYKAVNGGAFLFLAQVSSPACIDNGTGSSGPGGPVPSGSLGNWVAMPSLNVAREGAAVIAVTNPNVAGQNYLFAVAGLNNTTYLSSYEYLLVNDDGTTANSWTTGSGSLATARAHLGAWAARTADASNVPASTYWVYFGPGHVSGGTYSSGVEALTVNSAGSISSFSTAATSIIGGPAGYAAFVGRGRLIAAGGANGPSTAERESQLGLTLTATGLWNASGPTLNNPRFYPGYAQSGAAFFVVGGDTGTGAASATGERAVK